MKKLITLLLITLFSYTANSQEILRQSCKTKDVVISAYETDKMTENSVVVKMNVMRLEKQAKDMTDLNSSDFKKIKKWARQFKSCTVYVDFKEEFKDLELNPKLKDEDLLYLIVREQKK
jgi:uncharacterized protein YkvS